ncbi:MAG: energy-coupling factor ABC transporter ATP-binding protein [Spirochaetota bacterium]|nr:MAG: energy-coupling factor ABC transporter ATP-binding protein [Spirochaetota bacterium]
MIEVSNLTVSYGNKKALEDLSFSVKEGEFLLITGPTGCGKSTLALCLTGLIPHTKPALISGRVAVDGLDTSTYPVSELSRHIGIVFQNPRTQLFHTTVADEVAFAPHNLKLSSDEIDKRVGFSLASTGVLHLRDRKLHTLSEGELQRVAIASVLSMRPKVIVLDEPAANLDWSGVGLLVSALSRLNKEHGITILVIEHRISAIYPVCNKVLILKEGQAAAFGKPAEVFRDKQRLISLGLRFPWRHVSKGPERYVPDGINPPDRDEKPLVKLMNVDALWGKHQVLHGIDLSIYPGEFIALVGSNGAGKTTLARVIAGLVSKKKGKVIWQRHLQRLPIGRKVGFIFQNNYEQLLTDSVEAEVSLGPESFGLDAEAACSSALEMTDLGRLIKRAPTSLSIGEKQRCIIASVLSSDPALIILDEPTVGQDWIHLSMVMRYLQLLSRSGKAILLITHDDKLVCRFAKRIVFLEHGRIKADGIPVRGYNFQEEKKMYHE